VEIASIIGAMGQAPPKLAVICEDGTLVVVSCFGATDADFSKFEKGMMITMMKGRIKLVDKKFAKNGSVDVQLSDGAKSLRTSKATKFSYTGNNLLQPYSKWAQTQNARRMGISFYARVESISKPYQFTTSGRTGAVVTYKLVVDDGEVLELKRFGDDLDDVNRQIPRHVGDDSIDQKKEYVWVRAAVLDAKNPAEDKKCRVEIHPATEFYIVREDHVSPSIRGVRAKVEQLSDSIKAQLLAAGVAEEDIDPSDPIDGNGRWQRQLL